MQEQMARRGVMAPPTRHDAPPLLHYERSAQPGLMRPAEASVDVDHSAALRTLLWVVATALGAAELLLLSTPTG
jgi:hypothetical protein